jgi:uncharacterized protein (TIGR00251 family)
MPFEIQESGGRLLLRLRVKPGAKRDALRGEHGGALKLQVKEPPEKGRANQGVIRLLSAALGVAANQIELVSGHGSQDKRVAISGLDERTLREKLAGQE